VSSARARDGFRHEALFYAGLEGFVDATAPLIRAAVRAGEPMLVVVSSEKIARLRSALEGDDASGVEFADMDDVGRNPARIIPLWNDYLTAHASSEGRVRGIGEPISASRTAHELVECERHEALLNLAFADAPPWWLACPYDAGALAPAVLDEAARNHPFVATGGVARDSRTFRGLGDVAAPFAAPLPDAPASHVVMTFGDGELHAVRSLVARAAADAGVPPARVEDLVLAVNEVATNSLLHGGGSGSLRLWEVPGSLVCEIADGGHIERPLLGRERPDTAKTSGFGLWLANQVCELVQVRSYPTGSVVRLHVSRG
jgi:anti-sigma regulatory factor (Ser/Thr protein kinase)